MTTALSDVFLTLPHVSVLCQFAIKSILLCDMLHASSQLLQCALFRYASIMTAFTWWQLAPCWDLQWERQLHIYVQFTKQTITTIGSTAANQQILTCDWSRASHMATILVPDRSRSQSSPSPQYAPMQLTIDQQISEVQHLVSFDLMMENVPAASTISLQSVKLQYNLYDDMFPSQPWLIYFPNQHPSA